MHVVLGEGKISTERARTEKTSFLRILRELCISSYLLNGGLGCSSQLRILDRWMKAYNRKQIHDRQIKTNTQIQESVLSCDEAIQFISQADDQVSTQDDYVSDLRLGAGGGAASRNRATLVDSTGEKLFRVKDNYDMTQGKLRVFQGSRAKYRWHLALEAVTTGDLPDEDYDSVNVFYSVLWKSRRASNVSTKRGWRRNIRCNVESIFERYKFKWAHPSAMLVSSIPNCINKNDIVRSLKSCNKKKNKEDGNNEGMTSMQPCEEVGNIQVYSACPPGQEIWKGIVIFENHQEFEIAEHKANSTVGIKIKSENSVPHIDDKINRAKARYDQAEALAAVHPCRKNCLRESQAKHDLRIARLGLRGYGEYKEGHLWFVRALQGLREETEPKSLLVESLNLSIKALNHSIQKTEEEIDELAKQLESLEKRVSNQYSEKIQGMTSVEALQALQNGRKEETTCPVCQEPLGDTGDNGYVTATHCGHLACSECFSEWAKEKQIRREKITCIECRKPVVQTVTIDPMKTEDQALVEERKNDAKILVQQAAKMLKENGDGQLEPRLWEALYLSIDLSPDVDRSRDRTFPAIPGDVLGHLRCQTGMPIHCGPKTNLTTCNPRLSSKIEALLKDLPRDELSVVFASSKEVVKHLLFVLEMQNIGCRGLFTGQSEKDSKEAIDQWHNDENVYVLIVQAGAAACGLTLTAARKLFLMEPFLKYEVRLESFVKYVSRI
jgi:hypothetical protein